MAYFTPYIDNLGIHVPTYQDIIEYYIAQAKDIFGSDIYLEEDSKDYQMISVIARSAASGLQAAVDSYNARNPDTAFDDVLDGLVSINGIQRKPSTYSSVVVTLTGIPYTLITGGVVQSTDGSRWDLPQEVVIDAEGTAQVTAIAQEKGSIIAIANTITTIVTPTYGWYSVTNLSDATPGQEAESTPALKARRKLAVATPSQTPLEGLDAAISAVLGVIQFKNYENDSGTTDARGFPGHSIVTVVEGGTNEDIAKAIAKQKNMGVKAYGDIIVPVTNEYGTTQQIGFFRPTITEVYLEIYIKAKSGYTTVVADSIKKALVNFGSLLPIGEDLYSTELYEIILSVNPDISPYFTIDPVNGVQVGLSAVTVAKQDLTADFKTKFNISLENIVLNVS